MVNETDSRRQHAVFEEATANAILDHGPDGREKPADREAFSRGVRVRTIGMRTLEADDGDIPPSSFEGIRNAVRSISEGISGLGNINNEVCIIREGNREEKKMSLKDTLGS